LLTSCAIQPGNYKLKKKSPSFSLESYNKHNSTAVLDTNGVYLYIDTMDTNDGIVVIHRFYRFFSNGRAYKSRTFYNEIPTAEYDNLENWEKKYDYGKGIKCYYEITDQGSLKLETYINAMMGYSYNYAHIESDELTFYKQKMRGWSSGSRKLAFSIFKKKAQLSNFEVDW